jgi:hypothetical protein
VSRCDIAPALTCCDKVGGRPCCRVVVGFTIAEFVPRHVMHLRQIIQDFPLIKESAAGADDSTRAEESQGRE